MLIHCPVFSILTPASLCTASILMSFTSSRVLSSSTLGNLQLKATTEIEFPAWSYITYDISLATIQWNEPSSYWDHLFIDTRNNYALSWHSPLLSGCSLPLEFFSFLLSVGLNPCIHQRARPTSFLRFPLTSTNASIVNITNSGFRRTI